MKAPSSTFTFVGYEANIQKGSIVFSYELEVESKRHEFCEALSFAPPSDADIQALKPMLESLLLVLGISYWKTYCPKTIIIKPFELTQKQAAFWNLVYTKGLGEFFYKNNIDYRGLVQFPYGDSHNPRKPDERIHAPRSLVLLGGGKDSIVTAQLFKAHGKDFSLFATNPVLLQRQIADTIGKDFIEVRRTLDPKLFELNRAKGVYNGHIPISAIYAFIGLLGAQLYDYRYVVASNEVSSNYGNMEYLGQEINHQWSKSFEFEREVRAYIEAYISQDLQYFSLLRPIHEIEIVRLFTKHAEYFSSFSSCNANFKISGGLTNSLWCGKCPKCAFIFLLLSAFLPKADVTGIFGKNMFADTSLLALYKELLGIEGFKPFECVGTPEESLWAFQEVLKRGEYTEDIIVKSITGVLHDRRQEASVQGAHVFDRGHDHAIPKAFSDIIPFL